MAKLSNNQLRIQARRSGIYSAIIWFILLIPIAAFGMVIIDLLSGGTVEIGGVSKQGRGWWTENSWWLTGIAALGLAVLAGWSRYKRALKLQITK